MSTFSTPRQIQRVRQEPRRRTLQVLRIAPLGASFLSITFAGPDLADFKSDSFDDHVKLMFPGADGETIMRDYTPLQFDPQAQTLSIEFALHEKGEASDWARQAQVGQSLVIGGPRGSMIVPLDFDWHLLIGDASALPAIRRRLAELPPTAQALVFLHLPDEGDLQGLESAGQVTLQRLPSVPALIECIDKLQLPAGEGFVWGGGEASLMKRLRQALVVDKGHPKQHSKISAYWRQGAPGFHQTLEDQELREINARR